jgi:hypothetical protein
VGAQAWGAAAGAGALDGGARGRHTGVELGAGALEDGAAQGQSSLERHDLAMRVRALLEAELPTRTGFCYLARALLVTALHRRQRGEENSTKGSLDGRSFAGAVWLIWTWLINCKM